MSFKYIATRRRRLLVGAAVALVLASAAGTGVALGLSDDEQVYVPELGVSVPASKLPQILRTLAPGDDVVDRPGKVGPPPADFTITPGQILGPETPVPVSAAVLAPENMWIVDTGRLFVGVYAGTVPDQPDFGRLMIFRDNHVAGGRQTMHAVDIPGVGAVTITKAPEGIAAAGMALTAQIEFRTKNGRTGTLDLKDDRISLDGG